MAITAMDMVQKHNVYLLVALLLTPSLVFANELTFEPSIKTNETYSDNINYDSQNEESSFVNQTSLGLITNYRSARTSYNIDFEAINATYSHDSDFNDIYYNLTSNADIQLWTNGLSLIGNASIINEPRNTANNIYADIVFGDTVQIERYSGGLSYSVDNSTYNLDTNLIYNTTKAEDSFGESEGYTAILNSQNGTNSAPIFWDITNNYLEIENNSSDGRSYQSEFKVGYITPYRFNPFIRYYDEDNSGNVGNGTTSESTSYGAGFRWLIATRLTADVSYNVAVDDNSDEDEEQQDNYYDVNLSWQPTQRTSLNAGVSQRFFGDSYSFNLTHSNKRLTNTISYSESIQVFTRDNFNFLIDGDLCSFSDATTDCFALVQEALIIDPQQDIPLVITEDESFSLYKTFTWSSVLDLRRTTFALNVDRSDRENLATQIKSLRESLDFRVSRDVSRYSTLDFTATYTKTDDVIGFPQERNSQYRYYKVSYNRELNKTLTFDVSLSHLNRASNFADFVYKENRISLELKKVL